MENKTKQRGRPDELGLGFMEVDTFRDFDISEKGRVQNAVAGWNFRTDKRFM